MTELRFLWRSLQQNTYDSLGNVLTQTDGNGNTTTFSYNRLELVRSQTTPGDESMDSYTVTNQYNTMGQVAAQKDSMGKETILTYNHNGQILSQTEQKQDGTQQITISNCYDKAGNLRFTTDANGSTTEYIYDGNNKLVQQKQLIKNGIERESLIQVTKDGVIVDGTHGARAALEAGKYIDVEVVKLTAPITIFPQMKEWEAIPGYIFTDDKMTTRKYGFLGLKGNQRLEPVFDYVEDIHDTYVIVGNMVGEEYKKGIIELYIE